MPTIKTVMQYYLKNHVDQKVIDKKRQKRCCFLINKHLGKFDLSEINADIINAYKIARSNKVCETTIRRELLTLKAAMNLSVSHRQISADLLFPVSLPQHAPPKNIWLTMDESHQFLECAREIGSRIYHFCFIALHTAARKRSIEKLQWRQIDFTSELIRFDDDMCVQKNKRRVPVPMSKELFETLMDVYQDRKERLSERDFVLITDRGVENDFEKVCISAYKKFKNEKFLKITPHCLRKTWATLAAQSGVSMSDIAAVTGDSINTIYKNYVFHSPEYLRSAVNFRIKNP